jgi:hypothetical protein
MAIFVMAIGLLALLTLFPLGAVQMAQALKDQRTAETNVNATALFKSLNLTNDGMFQLSVPNSTNTVFQDPWPNILPVLPAGQGYPLYVDPVAISNQVGVGASTTNPSGGLPLGNVTPGIGVTDGIRRCTVLNGVITANPARWCTLQDDINFADNGLPADLGSPAVNGNVIQREGRYSFAYMVRRVNANNSDLPLDLTVIVYSGRATLPDISGNPPGETAFGNVQFLSDRLIDIPWAGTKPVIRRGSWIIDARMSAVPPVPAGSQVPVPQGYFYRVTTVTDIAAGVLEIEVQSPSGGTLRNNLYGTNPVTGTTYTGTIIVMDNVSEVFEKNTNY